jgi:oxygen-dependent protoporphyrinogen oxidase
MNARPQRIAIVGGGIAGLTAAWQLAQLAQTGALVDVTLFEASPRFGGTVETVRREGFTIETGPDGWVTEKPWARDLAVELGLAGELIGSNDATRVTYILNHGCLAPMPNGMRMMVPTDLAALASSPLFSESARAAYAAEPSRAESLKAAAPSTDESIAAFVERHFGREVLNKVGAPLLSGVFGGDVDRLSVRAVMSNFVEMERQHGSLILALQRRTAADPDRAPQPIFSTLASGVGSLIDSMLAAIPPHWLHESSPVQSIARGDTGWSISTNSDRQTFDTLLLAIPAHQARDLLAPILPEAAALITIEASSATIVAFAFSSDFDLPRGFGFLVPAAEQSSLLAATFTDQKFPQRAPAGKRLVRAFFGGEHLSPEDPRSDTTLAEQALSELEKILGTLPVPDFHIVRRWPRSLPQYEVGHLDRMATLDALIAGQPNLYLLGNAYHGVGLPDLIRDARKVAHTVVQRESGAVPSTS